MRITAVVPQLRTTNLAQSVEFYTKKLGFALEFQYQDFYAGVRIGDHAIHLKLVDERDPSIDFVEHGDHFHLYLVTDDLAAVVQRLKDNGVPLLRDLHETAWSTREAIIRDDQGHILYFAENR